MKTEKPTVPPQQEGAQKNIEYAVREKDEQAAHARFTAARQRLMDVNHWHVYSKPVTATFKLTDPQGNEVARQAQRGDYFKIDLPAAPGPAEGRGYDWVRIETIDDHPDPNGARENFAMRVRPAADPTQKGENVAHFFSEASTSSFVVERQGNEVTAAVYGRNEKPNMETSNLVDKVRNAVVGTSAILGFSNVQWSNLVKGVVGKD